MRPYASSDDLADHAPSRAVWKPRPPLMPRPLTPILSLRTPSLVQEAPCPPPPPSDLTSNLADWLWQAACAIRGPVDAPKYKDYILPLIFLKRLSDVLDDEVHRLAGEFGERDTAQELVERDHALVRFYVPPEARWDAIRRQSSNLGEYLTDAMRARRRTRLCQVPALASRAAARRGGRLGRAHRRHAYARHHPPHDAQVGFLLQRR